MAQEIVQTAGRKRSGAVLVGAGILLSRISGLIREIAFAHFFGNSDAADVFKAALRIPNFLQNLFGEGALSASFIPVYAGLRARGETEEACKLAGGVAVLLGLAVSVLVLVGVLSAPLLVDIITPGFEGAKRLAVIDLVRILFPGAGLLVFSAWCLGVLNSHRRFFMSYAAPVIWNASLIAALLIYGGRCREYDLALILAWSSVLGSLLQLLVQLPTTIKLVEKLVLKVDRCLQSLRLVVRNFFPVVIGRGVVQISAYVDSIIASLLPSGALASLMYAQTIYLLPVGLFGIAVSAAELPELSSAAVLGEGAKDMMRKNLAAGLRKISFFILPAIVVFIGLGQQIIGAVYQSGRFSAQDTLYVWAALAGLAPGLYAATLGRLYASGFFALHNTKIPVRCAVLRVAFAGTAGYFAAQYLPGFLGIDAKWGIAGLTGASALGAWIEYSLLRRGLSRIIGRVECEPAFLASLWQCALAALVAALAVQWIAVFLPRLMLALVVLSAYGGTYLGLALRKKIPEAQFVLSTLRPHSPRS